MAKERRHKPDRIDTVIIGIGATGMSCARFLANRKLPFAMTDTREVPPGLEEARRAFPDITIRTGLLDMELIMQARQCLVSPGISIHHPVLVKAAQEGIEIIGDTELFARHVNTPVIGITGSNGKSTVTTLVHEMAKASGKDVKAGGNLGTPALDLLEDPEPDLYVLELSSFQLETTHSLNPIAATVLNISEDHMDRYSDVAEYADAKERIFLGDGVMVLNGDDPVVARMAKTPREIIRFTLGEPQEDEFGLIEKGGNRWLGHGKRALLPVQQMKIQGLHNVANALAALALGHVAGFDEEMMLEVLRTWSGLPHRCQWVAEAQGVDWYNDSKGTNEGATVAAIKGFGDRPIILIAGGDAKGAKFNELADAARGRVKQAILFGQDASLLKQVLEPVTKVQQAKNLEQAVSAADRIAKRGDRVLFSPACASLDMFENYQARGQAFIDAVYEILRDEVEP